MNVDNIFKSVPIFARIAYSIRCLEKTLLFYKCSINQWKWILEKLWEFSTSEWFDEWCYEITCYLPNIILEEEYSNDNYEYINEEQYNRLYAIYSNVNEVVIKMFSLVYDISEAEIYSRIIDFSQNTLVVLEKIIDLMSENNIEPPKYADLTEFSFSINNGWGGKISKEYSLILNNHYPIT